ncbi:winged helix-turn-helix domain-containing protein [Streptomyces venezuelae]|uniref:winged helix-turn-helix domain-containing protein n=1 Tax=Streptomyces venezuelae TaxID=54571 RepID=UPI0037A37693
MVGNARATLPADLATARSTAEFAARTGYAPGTVSCHLSALHRARLVTKVRDGRYVARHHTPSSRACRKARSRFTVGVRSLGRAQLCCAAFWQAGDGEIHKGFSAPDCTTRQTGPG